MADKNITNLLSRWARAGAGFAGIRLGPKAPDLELLLLDTARHAPAEPRLFIMAATWLSRYEQMIARDRLAKLIRDELDDQHKPTMGLLLDIARSETGTRHLNKAIDQCRPADDPMPLFDIERKNATIARIAERRASEMSRRWGRWTQPIELKHDALRPAWWIIAKNGDEFRLRADLRGDLRLSILLALKDDPNAGASELELARACNAQRHGIRHALEALEIAGRIRVARQVDRHRVVLAA